MSTPTEETNDIQQRFYHAIAKQTLTVTDVKKAARACAEIHNARIQELQSELLQLRKQREWFNNPDIAPELGSKIIVCYGQDNRMEIVEWTFKFLDNKTRMAWRPLPSAPSTDAIKTPDNNNG